MDDEQAKEISLFWQDGAEDAYETAEVLFAGGKFVFALFFCHLVLEKTLKALIVRRTQAHAPYKHNLAKLAEDAGIALSDAQAALLDEIDAFNIQGRYDDFKRALHDKATKEFTKRYLLDVHELFAFLKSTI